MGQPHVGENRNPPRFDMRSLCHYLLAGSLPVQEVSSGSAVFLDDHGVTRLRLFRICWVSRSNFGDVFFYCFRRPIVGIDAYGVRELVVIHRVFDFISSVLPSFFEGP